MPTAHVAIEPDQYEFLMEKAKSTGQPVAELVHRAIERLRRDDEDLRKRAVSLLGAFEAEENDLSIRHDEVFAQVAQLK